MQGDKGVITGHFLSHWGIPKDIRPRSLQTIGDFAILEFAPQRGRASWRYATNGMSSYTQYYPDGPVKVRTELYTCSNERKPWVDDLLAAIATYPLDFKTHLA